MSGFVVVKAEIDRVDIGQTGEHLKHRKRRRTAAGHIIMFLPMFRLERDIG